MALLQSSDDFRHRFAKAASIGLAPESIEQVIYVQFRADMETVLKDEISVLREEHDRQNQVNDRCQGRSEGVQGDWWEVPILAGSGMIERQS